MAMHYFGVCQQIGLGANAFLIASELKLMEILDELESLDDDHHNLRLDRLREQLCAKASAMRDEQSAVAGEAERQLAPRRIDIICEEVYANPNVATFAIDGGAVRVNLFSSSLDACAGFKAETTTSALHCSPTSQVK